MNLRTKVGGLFAVLALCITAVIAAPSAHAVTTIKRGGSCNLSANWKVNFSATWYDGQLAYAVASSPAPLDVGSGLTYAYGFESGGSEDESMNMSQFGAGPPYVYRGSVLQNHAHLMNKVFIQARVVPPDGSGVCNVTLTR
jgi:hypothetical protein